MYKINWITLYIIRNWWIQWRQMLGKGGWWWCELGIVAILILWPGKIHWNLIFKQKIWSRWDMQIWENSLLRARANGPTSTENHVWAEPRVEQEGKKKGSAEVSRAYCIYCKNLAFLWVMWKAIGGFEHSVIELDDI